MGQRYDFLAANGKVRPGANILQEKREDVISKLVNTEPRHGEIWQTVAKAPQNASKSLPEILQMVIAKLDN